MYQMQNKNIPFTIVPGNDGRQFNNCNHTTNGELSFWNTLYQNGFANVIFDVGAKESAFTSFKSTVHYFEPLLHKLDNLKQNVNVKSFYNPVCLGKENKDVVYYKDFESMYDRSDTCPELRKNGEKFIFKCITAANYITHGDIQSVDFLKIDVEGAELDVLKGFGEKLSLVKFIQFEYGGTYIDAKIKISDVTYYLRNFGFDLFYYIHPDGLVPLNGSYDHYLYCNIVCFRSSIFS
jgi:FkbM family methyltransferase